MSAVITVPTTEQKLLDADKLVALAVNHDVKEIVNSLPIERIKSLAVENWPRLLGYYTSQLISDDYHSRYDTQPLPSSDFVVRTGVRDTARVIAADLSKIPHKLSFEQALGITKHPQTLHSIALAAMRPSEGENGFSNLIDAQYPFIVPTPDYTAIDTDPLVLPRGDGCPEAGDATTLTVSPTPLFRHFSEWSAELALRSLHYHEGTENITSHL